mgnify:FL=1
MKDMQLKFRARCAAASVELKMAELVTERVNATNEIRNIVASLKNKRVSLPGSLPVEIAADILPEACICNDEKQEYDAGCITAVKSVSRGDINDAEVEIYTLTEEILTVPVEYVMNPETVLRFIEMFLTEKD